jgi:hypothetical protein
MNLLWAAIARLESLIARVSSRASVTSITSGLVENLPDDGVQYAIGSVRVDSPHPILVITRFFVKDNVLDRVMVASQRAVLNGNAVTPVLVSNSSEFSIVQPGLVNPPALTQALSVDGLSLEARATNPVAGNVVDIEVTMEVQISQA